jgi:plasmid stabilization system protein ParE
MKVRYTPRAFSDLDVIRTYISQFDPAAAGRVVGLIEEIVKRLGDFPESGQRADELDTRIAFSPRYPYRIYYRVASDEILILHIRHAARRPLQRGEI